MKLQEAIALRRFSGIEAAGTSEGAKKAWDTRGRSAAKPAYGPDRHPKFGYKLSHSELRDKTRTTLEKHGWKDVSGNKEYGEAYTHKDHRGIRFM